MNLTAATDRCWAWSDAVPAEERSALAKAEGDVEENSHSQVSRRRFLIAVTLLATPRAIQAQPSGSLELGGFRATVKTVGYNQAASFYSARRLPIAFVERYAGMCVVLVNTKSEVADATTSLRLVDWRVRAVGMEAQQIRGRGSWLKELDRQEVSTAARVAFEWAQLPEEVDLSAGDSVQGMLSLPVARGIPFDLVLRWRSGQDRHEATISTIRCD